jgi:hypothetical protein
MTTIDASLACVCEPSTSSRIALTMISLSASTFRGQRTGPSAWGDHASMLPSKARSTR